MFPKISRIKKNNLETVNVNFLKERLQLVLDKELCIGCNMCARACPKEAITKKQLDEPIKFSTKQIIKKVRHHLIPNVHDPEKCSYCGVCAYVCPANALSLVINGETVNTEELSLIKQKALPKLDFKIVKTTEGKDVRAFTEGSVTINTKLCAGGCKNCADSCHFGAITWSCDQKEITWDSEIILTINSDKCIACGACHSACPTGALMLTVDNVKYSGEYNGPFWDLIESRIRLNERQ
ncbi:MAG: 4Fe-4S binding protein [Promethearchaeota archaeon]